MSDRPEAICKVCGKRLWVNPYSSPYTWYHCESPKDHLPIPETTDTETARIFHIPYIPEPKITPKRLTLDDLKRQVDIAVDLRDAGQLRTMGEAFWNPDFELLWHIGDFEIRRRPCESSPLPDKP